MRRNHAPLHACIPKQQLVASDEQQVCFRREQFPQQLIDESLDFYGIKSRQDARDLVRRARAHSKLGEDQALAVAQEQVRAVRRKP